MKHSISSGTNSKNSDTSVSLLNPTQSITM
nr:MAG TPA: hypothetical protein [Bacteriophage sp.]